MTPAGAAALAALVDSQRDRAFRLPPGRRVRTTRQVPSGERYSRVPCLSSWWWGISFIVVPRLRPP